MTDKALRRLLKTLVDEKIFSIETLSMELRHAECCMRIKGKSSEYYEELSQIAEVLRMAIEALKKEADNE